MTKTDRLSWWLGGLAALAFLGWSFQLAVQLPLDSWDAYDYLVNARWLAGHDLTRLSQTYRVDRPPGISLLVAPLIAWGYQPGQRGVAAFIHLVPWAVGVWGLWLLWRQLRTSFGVALAFAGTLLLALNPLVLHFLPFVMADVPSMTFALLALMTAELAVTCRRGVDLLTLAFAVMAAMLSKYPVAALGVAIPLANAAWGLAGKGRPTGVRAVLWSLVQPRLAVPLLLGLGGFLAVESAIFSKFVPGAGTGLEKLRAGMTSAWGSAGGGSSGGATDPRWELPLSLFALFGAPAALFAVVGVVRAFVARERRALLHASWALCFLGLFAFIGHKEARYAFPVLPSCVWLAVFGLSWLGRRAFVSGAMAVALLAALPMSVAELSRMNDPLYRKPSILAWARFALDRSKGEKPLLQVPVLPQFGLYPKDPVVLDTDEFWHFHHFNEGGLTWFFDQRLQALQVTPGAAVAVRHESPWFFVQVPNDWLARLGDDAVFLAAFPKGAVLLSTSQGWFETRTAAQAVQPPAPFVAIDVQLDVLALREQTAEAATFGKALSARRTEAGWVLLEPKGRVFVRDVVGNPSEWSAPRPELPGTVEVVSRERVEFPVR